jgi:hypothetical protein
MARTRRRSWLGSRCRAKQGWHLPWTCSTCTTTQGKYGVLRDGQQGGATRGMRRERRRDRKAFRSTQRIELDKGRDVRAFTRSLSE